MTKLSNEYVNENINEELDKENCNEEVLVEEAEQEAETEQSAEQNEEIKAEDEQSKVQNSKEDEAFKDKYLRLMADFQNYKKRAEKDRLEAFSYAEEKIILQLLPILDNFERSLELDDTSDFKAYAQGVNMIYSQLIDVLNKAGLEKIEALGTLFDPALHNAVMTDDNSEFESGHVTKELQKGYSFKKKVIRPSMVMVNN